MENQIDAKQSKEESNSSTEQNCQSSLAGQKIVTKTGTIEDMIEDLRRHGINVEIK